MSYINELVSILILLVCGLGRIAFFTLLERKILGYIILRKGPTKCGIGGILQPIADAGKLFFKSRGSLRIINILGYEFFPIFGLILSLLIWRLFPYSGRAWLRENRAFLFLCLSGLGIYVLLGGGFRSNSKYALLGALRRVAQTISYEIRLALTLLLCLFYFGVINLGRLKGLSWLWIILCPLFFVWLVTCLAESIRTPFDNAEGESELVSGFNVEYGGRCFSYLFMAEYLNIIFLSFITVYLFFSFEIFFKILIFGIFIIRWFILIRGLFPRIRYDKLMNLCWKDFLPLVLGYWLIIWFIN